MQHFLTAHRTNQIPNRRIIHSSPLADGDRLRDRIERQSLPERPCVRLYSCVN